MASSAASAGAPQDRAAPHIVIIDDDGDQLDVMAAGLERAGFGVTGFTHPRDGLYHLIDHPAALVVVDLCMPEMTGLDLLLRLQASRPDLPLIGISGGGDSRTETMLRTMRTLGAVDCLRKPISPKRLVDSVRKALRSESR